MNTTQRAPKTFETKAMIRKSDCQDNVIENAIVEQKTVKPSVEKAEEDLEMVAVTAKDLKALYSNTLKEISKKR